MTKVKKGLQVRKHGDGERVLAKRSTFSIPPIKSGCAGV